MAFDSWLSLYLIPLKQKSGINCSWRYHYFKKKINQELGTFFYSGQKQSPGGWLLWVLTQPPSQMPDLHTVSLHTCIWFSGRTENIILSREFLGAALLLLEHLCYSQLTEWSGSLELVCGGESPTPIRSLAKCLITNREGADVHSVIPAGAHTRRTVTECQKGIVFLFALLVTSPQTLLPSQVSLGFCLLSYISSLSIVRRWEQVSNLPFLSDRGKLHTVPRARQKTMKTVLWRDEDVNQGR